ncbi:MAG: S41 family peptidase [Candidatus Pacebacteria bacterium]|nr:S41 family peptidase [Candidatus Paceibacterota bacterium]
MNTQDRKIIIFLVGLPALIFAFFIGMYVGGGDTPGGGALGGSNSAVSDDEFAPFWRAWRELDDKYVAAASTTPQERVWGSIEGLAASYGDPYTVFFPPVEAKMFAEEISGNFEGVGMEIGVKDKQLQVVAPIKNSPAERAGVKAGDLILKIDEKSASDMSTDAAVKLIRGAKGTAVKITFLPKGATKPVERTIIRDVIDIPTLDTERKEGGIFVIRLYSFTANSANLFRNALREFVLSGDKKLILDLRGNPGGYLDASWDMASWFLPAGQTVVTEDFGGNAEPKVYRSKGYNIFTKNLKMLVLVDGGSASASEILAGALKENGVAKLLGTKTFGKGSVQQLISITSDTSLKVTIARWLTPGGHNLSHDGLEPDYKVEPTEKDIADKNDVQMAKAVEILNAAQ